MADRSDTRKAVRLIALDLDGTLLDDDKQVPARNRAALGEAASRGVVIALASGRMTDCISPTADELGIDCPIIGYNGAMVRGTAAEGRPTFFHRPVEARYGRELVDYCRGRYMLNFYLDDTLCAEETPELRRFADIYANQTGATYSFVPDLGAFADRESTKFIIVTDPAERDRLYAEWAPRWGEETNIVRTNPEYLEFMNRTIDKGVGLEALCGALGIELERAMALGDADNDAAMLAAAGIGVAMANASDLTKAAADVVSEFRYDEDAVAEAVERYVLRT